MGCGSLRARFIASVLLAASGIACLHAGTAAAAAEKAAAADTDHEKEPPLADLLQAIKAAGSSDILPGSAYGVASLPSYGIRIHAWSFDQGRYSLRVAAAKDERGSRIAAFLGTSDLLAINGGFFELDKQKRMSPSGLLIVDGKTVAPEQPRAGSGILYAGPAGVGIGYRKDLGDHGAMQAAVQVGPILVDPGGRVGVLDKQHDRQNRSAVCLEDNTFTIFVVEGGLSLFQLASVLAATRDQGGYGCDVAINLDGGPSSQAIFRSGSHEIAIDGSSPVQNALIVSPKAP